MHIRPGDETETNEAKFRNLISQAPVLINTFITPAFIVETIIETALEFWGKSFLQVIKKIILTVLLNKIR